MARDKRKTMVRIGVLLDECQICPKHISSSAPVDEVERTCGGCSVYTELRQLGAGLQQESHDRFRPILDKGQDMTKSDIAFLLENGVKGYQIQEALGLSKDVFWELMVNQGFSKRKMKKGVEKVAVVEGFKLSIEEYGELKKKGLKDFKIAERLGIDKQQLANWKYLRKDQLVAAGLANTKKQTKKQARLNVVMAEQDTPSMAAPKADKTSEYAQLINELSDALDAAKDDLKEKDKLIQGLEYKISRYENIESDYHSLVNKVGDFEDSYKAEIQALHDASDDLEKELYQVKRERDSSIEKNYQTDYRLENVKHSLEKKIKQLDLLEKENAALRDLVKLWI